MKKRATIGLFRNKWIGRLCMGFSVVLSVTFPAISKTIEQPTPSIKMPEGATDQIGICSHKPSILSLANKILERRLDMPGFSQARYGSVATYLLLKYGDLSSNEAQNLLDHVKTAGHREPQMFSSLELAYYISHFGLKNRLTINDSILHKYFSSAGLSGYRSIILLDEGKSFLELVKQVKTDPEYAENFKQNYVEGLLIPLSILDQSDLFKLTFAINAEKAGELVLAGMVLASRKDLSPYIDFLKRHQNNESVMRFTSDFKPNVTTMTIQYQSAPLEIGRQLSNSDRLQEQILFDIFKAGFFVPEMDFINIARDQSQHDAEFGHVARSYLDARQSGQISQSDSAEVSWLFIYKSLVKELGYKETQSILSSFHITPRFRHFAGSGAETINWMVAVDAVTPYITAQTSIFPIQPDVLPKDFDWARWKRVAQLVRNTYYDELPNVTTLDLDISDAIIAVELLFQTGDTGLAVETAEKYLPIKKQVPILSDFMKRLDQKCGNYLSFPGRSILLGGNVIFDFLPITGRNPNGSK